MTFTKNLYSFSLALNNGLNVRTYSTSLPLKPLASIKYTTNLQRLGKELKQLLLPYYNMDNNIEFLITFNDYNNNVTIDLHSNILSKSKISNFDVYITELVDVMHYDITSYFYEENILKFNRKGYINVFISSNNDRNIKTLEDANTVIPDKNTSLTNIDEKVLPEDTTRLTPKKFIPKDFSTTKKWFVNGDYTLILDSVFFKESYIKNYDSHLHLVLKNDNIVSCIFKACLKDEGFRCLNVRFGYKFDYNELQEWDFTKSPYYDKFYKMFLKYSNFEEAKVFWEMYIHHYDYLFENHQAPLNLDQFYIRFCVLIIEFILKYHFDEEALEYFLIEFTALPNYVNHTKSVKNINSIPLKKGISNIKDIRKSFKNSVLPLTLDENAYGKRGYATRTYIDTEKDIKRVITDISSSKWDKKVYSLSNNRLIESYIDEKIDETTFERYNVKTQTRLTVKNDEVIKSSMKGLLPEIKNIKDKNVQNSFNKHIGSFDLEVFLNTKTDINEVYAVGFAYGGDNVTISKPDVFTYYLDKNKSSSDIVIECIMEMLKTKYNKAVFYTHNLGGYDVVFLLKILSEYNIKLGEEFFKLKTVLKDNKILKLKISATKKGTKVKNSITLVDSLALLPASLDSLSKGFNTEYKKLIFPYSFVTDKTLNYIGVTPAKEYYNTHKDDLSEKDYKSLIKEVWNLKEETLKYLESDLISLLQIMYEFGKNIHEKHHIEVSECLTLTGLAVKIFLGNYYCKDKQKSLGLLQNRVIYTDIKNAYFGGLSEVYKPYGENLYYYDVNSLYPYASLNDMPGNQYEWIESYTEEGLDLKKDNLFGYFYCDVKTPLDDYIGILPVRQHGLLTHPLGEFSGWWFTPLLEYAIENNYQVTIRKGYKFNRVSNIFDDYIKELYKEKQNTTGARRLIAKFLLNGLLGRFGMHLDKKITSLITTKENYDELITKYLIYDEKIITKNLCLLSLLLWFIYWIT